jgi:heterodisulfide reductase subunit C
MAINWERMAFANYSINPPNFLLSIMTYNKTMLKKLLNRDKARRQALVEAYVVPEPGRCVQCGICTFNCPIEIDVRRHAWQGIPVKDSHCLTCSECVDRCPRGVLHLQQTTLFEDQ